MYAGVQIKISLSASSITRLFINLFYALEFPRLVHLIQKYRWQYFHYLDIILLIVLKNNLKYKLCISTYFNLKVIKIFF